MICEFEHFEHDERYQLTIFFRYSQDEETLLIGMIEHIHFETRPDKMGRPEPDHPFPTDD